MYTRRESPGVTRDSDGAGIPANPANKDWRLCQEWLSQGNTPAPMPAAVVPSIDDEYDALSDWMKELIVEVGANLPSFKAKVVARRNQ